MGSIVVGDLMNTRNKFSLIINLLFICIFFVSSMASYAMNSLSGVDINQTDKGNYNIVLKTDSAAKIDKISEKNNSLIITLTSVVPVESLEILYDNISDIKNVMVQKKNSDNTMVIIEGNNIENANIYLNDLSLGTIKPVDANISSLNNYLYIENVKYFTFCVVGIFIMFLLMLSFRPKQEKYTSNVKKQYNTVKNTTINKINKKHSNVQKRYIPSINYRITGLEANMTVPDSLRNSASVIFEEERERKAG